MVGVNFVTMLFYDPYYLTEKDGAPGIPHWIYYTYACIFLWSLGTCSPHENSWAAGLFIYQSFDAIDGYVILQGPSS